MTTQEDQQKSLFDLMVESGVERCMPIRTVFELTYRCNLACDFCYCQGREDPELSTDEVCSAIQGLRSEGCMFLALSGGEILCRTDFWEIAQYARSEHMALELKTNGTLLDEDAAERMAALLPMNVDISFHAAEPAIHDAVTGVRGSFDAALKGLRLLKGMGVPVTVKSLLTRENYREYDRIRALAADLGADCLVDITVTAGQDGGCGAHRHRIDDEQLAELVAGHEADFLMSLTETLTEEDFREAADLHQCNAGLTTCCINPYGDVFPCVQFLRRVGSVRETDLHSIWHGSGELDRIRQVRLKDLQLCSSCDLLHYCIRCPGLADLEDGDMLGPSHEACRQARAIRDQFRGRSCREPGTAPRG